MKIKKLLSMTITLSLIIGMFTCIPVHAAGASEDVFNFNFEDGVKWPSFSYGGNNYNVGTAGSGGTASMNDGYNGRIADKCLYITSSTGGNGQYTDFIVPNISSLKDIGGGALVVSWNMAVEALEGTSEYYHYIYLVKKSSSGTYSVNTVNFYMDSSTMYLNFGSGHNNQLQNLGARPTDGAWHKYDLVLYYGTGTIEFYQDNARLKRDTYAPRTLDKNDSGATIAGIAGDSSNTMMFRARYKNSGSKKLYYDNIRLRRYASTETFYPGFSDDFESSIVTLTAAGSGSNRLACDNSSATFSGETGVYGKSATDTSIKITKKTDAASGSQGMYYENVGSSASYQEGGTVRIGFNLAFNNENKMSNTMFNKFFELQPLGGTRDTVFSLAPGALQYGSNSIDVPWEGDKWYKFDVYITPGDGSTIKNKATVYMNGKLMFGNYELSDYSFTQIADIRIGQREQVIKGYDDNITYIDDFSYDYTPAGITPVYPNVALSSSSANFKIVDIDTVFIEGSATAGDVDSAVSVTGGTKYMISDTQTLANTGDNATDSYILVRAANDEIYIYPIVSDKIDRYVEDFSSHTYSAGEEIRYWVTQSVNNYPGTRTPVTGLAGKEASDQSLKNTQGRTAHNIEGLGIIPDPNLKIIMEFNFLMNDTAAQELVEAFYDYKNSGGTVTSVTFAPFLNLQNGTVNAFGTAVGTYEQNKWNKYVLEIDPTAFTADVYQNGTKIATGVRIISAGIDVTGCTITKIKRFKYQHAATTDTTASKWSAIDDIKIYIDKEYKGPLVPTDEEIAAALNTAHPRLMVTDFNALAQLIKTNPTYKKWYYYNKGASNENKHSVEYRAQLYAGYPMPVYEDDDPKRIVSSETFRDRVILFAFNYKISNLIYSNHSNYYKNLVWNYLNSAKDWPDWGHGYGKQFLDTADMIMAYAIAYDWLYDDWTEEERTTIRNTLKTKGLQYAESIFNGNPNNYSSWLDRHDNWTAWCNSAVILGALAIADEDEMGIPLVRNALENLPNCYDAFGSDGDWNEGTGYWEKAMHFLAIALSSCETALGSDFGHKYAEGLSETGFYSLYMCGREDAFGLNDSSGDNQLCFDFYFGKLFNNKYLNSLRYYQLQELGADAILYDLIWYDESDVSIDFLAELSFDKYYRGIETVAMRAGGFCDNTTAFAALHAGYNNVNHGHLDGGTFAYETNGVRWAIDLGSDNYTLFNYFQTSENAYQGKNRWCYYRCRAEGHNTWVINPGSGAEQSVEGEGEILKNSFTRNGTSYSIADLTDFYSSTANSVKRGIMLNKSNGALTVRDELSLKSSSTLYWFMHTNATITISQDGKSAILTQDGRRLWVGIIDGSGTFTSMSATRLSSSPNPDTWTENYSNNKQQDTNTGVNKLSIKYTGKSGTLNQTVYMVELEDGQSAPATIPQSTSLNNWEE